MDAPYEDALDVAENRVGIGSGIDRGGTASPHPSPPLRSPVGCEPQLHAYTDVVVVVFDTSDSAEAAVELLCNKGFSAGECGLVVRDGPLTHARGLLARAGCADGDAVEALTRLGVPEEAARQYQQAFDAWQPVLLVRAPACLSRAVSALQQAARPDRLQALIDPRPLQRQLADRPDARRQPGRSRAPAAVRWSARRSGRQE